MNAVVKLSEARAMGMRIPPHSVEAEQAVLGGLMLAPDKLDTIADKLSEDDFYRKDHRMIWRAISELAFRGQPCDAVTLGEWFESNGLAQMMGGPAYVVELASNTPSAANIAAYAQIIREKSVRRQMIDKATDLVEQSWNAEGDTAELLDVGISGLMGLQRVETRYEYTLRQAMTMAYKEAQEARERGTIPGISTGLTMLDRALGGFHDTDLIVIGARPAMGKTALLMNFVVACPFPCGIISAEMPVNQVGGRIMSIKSHVPAELMRTGRFEVEHLRKLECGIGELSERICLIYDRSSPTDADVARIARKWIREHGIRVLYLDYAQRIRASKVGKNANRSEKVGEVIRSLKEIARELRIPVVVLAQVGRQAEGRQPKMGDLSDSSEIEKEADVVITLDRPHEYDESQPECLANLSIEKNRHGPTWTIKSAWLPETMRFEDYEESDYD